MDCHAARNPSGSARNDEVLPMRHLLASAALLALSPIALASPLAAQDGAAMTDETAKQDLTFEARVARSFRPMAAI